MNFMTVNKLVGKFIDKQINAMKIRAFTSISKAYNVFSLKISALDIVSGQKSAPRCNQSFPVNLHVINVREVSSQFSCLYIKKGEKVELFLG